MTPKERDSARRADVLKGGGGDFFVAPNPSANPNAPSYEDPLKSQVGTYDKEIELVAARENVDPDLIRTIMYIETTHGQYFGLAPLADALGISKTILPMNIYASLWGKLGSRSDLEIPINNITAGAKILKGIIGNLAEPSVAVVATLYNALDATSVSDYGARAAAVYKTRPWKNQ